MSNELTTNTDVMLTPLKSGGRMDAIVRNGNETPAAFESTAIVDRLRAFFAELEAEAEQRKDDPVAMVNALARMEALAADVRYVTSTIRAHAAQALHDQKVRRMTIEGLATVEASTTTERTDWQDTELLTDMIAQHFGDQVVSTESGNIWTAPEIAEQILMWFRVQWRLTPIRDAGLDPDDYSTVPTDEDHKPIRFPTVSFKENVLRKQQVVDQSVKEQR